MFYLVTTKELLVSFLEVLQLVQLAALLAVAHHGVLLVVDAPHYSQDPVRARSRPGHVVTRDTWPVSTRVQTADNKVRSVSGNSHLFPFCSVFTFCHLIISVVF